jgi:hypothetical protein
VTTTEPTRASRADHPSVFHSGGSSTGSLARTGRIQAATGLAEFNDETLGELLEKIVLHSFEPVPGDEGESSASPHSKAQLKAIEDLKKVYGLDYAAHSARDFPRQSSPEG